MIGSERDAARRGLQTLLRGRASRAVVEAVVGALDASILLPLRDVYTFAAIESVLGAAVGGLVDVSGDPRALLDEVHRLRELVARLSALGGDPPFHTNIVDCDGLRSLRDAGGRAAVLTKLSEPDLVVGMSKRDMKRQLHVSQSFLDQDKLARAFRLPRKRFEVACGYGVGDDGNARFILRDGHHRALLNYVDGVGVFAVPSADVITPVMSFRNYYRHHGMDLRSE